MRLGIFSKTFAQSTMQELFDKMVKLGFENTHFPLSYAGLPTPLEHVGENDVADLRKALQATPLTIESLSGTYNMIDPDETKRSIGKKQLFATIDAADLLNIPYVTLCTGTFDTQSMWKAHPDNNTKQAWTLLTKELETILPYAEEKKITLLLETEQANVINNAEKCRALMDEMQSENLKVIMDGANLFSPDLFEKMDLVLNDAFELLGADIRIAHAKDIGKTPGLSFVAAGDGILDYDLYFALLKKIGFDGALQLHGLSEEQVEKSLAFVSSTWENA